MMQDLMPKHESKKEVKSSLLFFAKKHPQTVDKQEKNPYNKIKNEQMFIFPSKITSVRAGQFFSSLR